MPPFDVVWNPFVPVNGAPTFVESALTRPAQWKTPRMIFVNSMSDFFHEGIDDRQRDMCFGAMQGAPQHIYQILTKRPDIAFNYFKRDDCCREKWLTKNIWLGVSAENSETLLNRALPLHGIEMQGVKFLSAEPLLGDLRDSPEADVSLGWFDWIICGGESGKGARVAGKWFGEPASGVMMVAGFNQEETLKMALRAEVTALLKKLARGIDKARANVV